MHRSINAGYQPLIAACDRAGYLWIRGIQPVRLIATKRHPANRLCHRTRVPGSQSCDSVVFDVQGRVQSGHFCFAGA